MTFNNQPDWASAIQINEFTETKEKELIHPSGSDEASYFNSGKYDSFQIIEKCNLKKDETICEFGCGDGRILRHLSGHYKVYGVDIVDNFINRSHKYNLNTTLVKDCKLKFNKIYSLTVFIHLNKEDSREALEFIYDHLEPGGTAHLHILVYGFDHDSEEYIQLNYWSKETLDTMVKTIGFNVEHIEEMEGDITIGQFAANHDNFCIFSKPSI
tara:strand:- start:135 stop:773 length:639 start_codon:yes stop_codon:yes gene_type:complete